MHDYVGLNDAIVKAGGDPVRFDLQMRSYWVKPAAIRRRLSSSPKRPDQSPRQSRGNCQFLCTNKVLSGTAPSGRW